MTNEPTDHEARKEALQTLAAVRHAGVAMVVAALVLLVFNSTGLQTWTRNLPGNAVTDRWVNEADNWHGLMARLGFAAPKSMVQDVVVDVREVEWPQSFGPDPAHALSTAPINLD